MTHRILVKTLVGSHMWGLQRPESDTDYRQVNLWDLRTALSPFTDSDRGEQELSGEDDVTHYNARRFLRLLYKGNPTMLELVFGPAVTADPVWDAEALWPVMDYDGLIASHRGFILSQIRQTERHEHRAGKSISSALLSIELLRGTLIREPVTRLSPIEHQRHIELRQGLRVEEEFANLKAQWEAIGEFPHLIGAGSREAAEEISLRWHTSG